MSGARSNRLRPFDMILFDLDGTLTDSAPGITRCVQFALARQGITVADPEELTPFVGPPLAESFARIYGFDAERSRRAIAAYRERFATVGIYENAPYPGIPALLAQLAKSGATLAVASSKPTPFVARILDHFALAQHFTAVVGSTLDQTRVAKEDVVAHALTLLPDHDRARTVMVGDREHDVRGARAHGIGTIAVTYGYGSPAELAAAGPLALADSVGALAALLGAPEIPVSAEPRRGSRQSLSRPPGA
jgi:phosphoglycolate phosphatase